MMHRPAFQPRGPRGYYDRDSGGGAYANNLGPRQMRPRTRSPSTNFHHNHNQQGAGSHPGSYRGGGGGRGQGFLFRPRGQPQYQHNRGELPFRGARGHPQNFGRGGPRHQQPYTPRQQWNPNFRSQHPHQHQERVDGPDKPWITPSLMEMIRERNESWEVYDRNKTEESYRLFKVKRIQVNMACNDAKLLYMQQNPHLQQCQGVYTPYWKPTKPVFYCDACDRKLDSKEALDEHNAEHITCKLDGCTYTAHAKLVMKHIELQHSNDLYHRIKGYDTPEEIEKWKEERRLNFPTPDNIIRKKAERAEMRARGETMGLKHNDDEEELFRYKILPEKRTRSSFRQNLTGPEYQSDGDEDVMQPKNKKMRFGQSSFSTYNKSPVFRLLNYYTDIEINEQGQLIGTTRVPWIANGHDDDEDTELMKFNRLENENEDRVEFNITDDEEDKHPTIDRNNCRNAKVDVNGQLDTIVVTGVLLPVATATKTNSTVAIDLSTACGIDGQLAADGKPEAGAGSLLGLLSYGSSDSESEYEDEKVGDVSKLPAVINNLHEVENTAELISGPTFQTGNATGDNNNNHSSTDDDEAPEEVAAIVSKSLSMNNPNGPVAITGTNEVTEELKPLSPMKRKPLTKNRRKKATTTITEDHKESYPSRPSYTLLQRLLGPDIRHERNVILQACRYIVDSNFFEEAPKTTGTVGQTDDTATPITSNMKNDANVNTDTKIENASSLSK